MTITVSSDQMTRLKNANGGIGKAVGEIATSADPMKQIALLQSSTAAIEQVVAELLAPPVPKMMGFNLSAAHFVYNGSAHIYLDRMKAADVSPDASSPTVYKQWGCTQWVNNKIVIPEPAVAMDSRYYPTAIPAGPDTTLYSYFPIDGALSDKAQRYAVVYNKIDVAFRMPGGIDSLSRPATATQVGLYVWDIGTFGIGVHDYSGTGKLEMISLGSPFKDSEWIAVVRYDQLNDFLAGKKYDAAGLSKLSRFGAVRFMDALHTNGSPVAKFADFPQANSLSYAKMQPLAACVDLANTLGIDAELPIPHMLDDAGITQMVSQIRDTLVGRYSCALSNEAGWQFSYPFLQGSYYNDLSQRADFKSKFGTDSTPLTVYGYYAARAMQLAIAAFGGKRDRLITNLGFQLVQPGTLYYRKVGAIQALREKGATPTTLKDCGFDAGQVTWYFGLPSENAADRAKIVSWAKGGAAGLDAAFKALNDGTDLTTTVSYRSIADLGKIFTQWGQNLAAEGLRLEGYEGGHAMTLLGYSAADRPYIADLRHRMRADDRMGDAYGAIWAAWVKAGGGRGYQFTDAASEEDSGDGDWFVWQMLSDPENPISRKIAAINGITI